MKKRKKMEEAAAIRSLLSLKRLNIESDSTEGIIEKLRDSLNSADIREEIISQEKGIPFEYQFGAICWWLGRCKHFQFIDTQPEFPYLSKIENVRYPDAFTTFNYNNSDFPCFIQIKSHNTRKLKLTPNYVSGLKKYPLLKGYPLLIAWKFREFWCLFDIDTFITESGGVNVKFEDAMKANLMSLLCGDFFFPGFREGIEWYLKSEPDEDIKLLKPEVEYTFTLRDRFFFGPDIDEISVLLLMLQPFLGLWESTNRNDEKYIYTGEKVVEENSMFASQVLPFALHSHAVIEHKKVDWKDILKNQKFVYTINDLREMIRFGQKHNLGFGPFGDFKPGISNPCMEPIE
jgi:hypothetical protein